MSKIAVVTDTNSGITREEAKKLGVYLLPMPFIVDGTEYFEGVTCTYEHFFEMLEAGAEVSTSQPSPESLTAMWEEALATLLGLKPVLQIQGGKLDAYAKVRGMANAEKTMLKALEKDLQTRFAGKKVHIAAAYSGDIKPALEWRKTIRKYFDDNSIELYKLPISICCHVSSGVKALGCFEYFE